MSNSKIEQERLLAWARYLCWADLHRKHLGEYFEVEGESELPGHVGRFVTVTSQWFASLWVVAEGFQQLNLRDNFIESILENPPGHADLLRRCRNGVYHFQPELIEPRLLISV